MRATVGLLLLVACSFEARLNDVVTAQDGGPDGDTMPPPPDARIIDITHLSPSQEMMLDSITPWNVDVATTIDTGAGTITPAPPAGVIVLDATAQEGGGDVMVIQAARIDITADVLVIGDKPLILVATSNISSSATIDASANHRVPGPGGSGPSSGPGQGADASNGNNQADAGGGGASFQFAGGKGGDCDSRTGAMPGSIPSLPATLVGGSGGGNGSPNNCDRRGGAGGGAIQLTAGTSITFTGAVINVGGGGGDRGSNCEDKGAGGSGGGSGGMMYLEAPSMTGTAQLVANGGGGGGAANADNLEGTDGGDAGVVAGVGGMPAAGGGAGGAGASATSTGEPGTNVSANNQNGGGGGGGGGWIFYDTTGTMPSFTASPPATPAQ